MLLEELEEFKEVMIGKANIKKSDATIAKIANIKIVLVYHVLTFILPIKTKSKGRINAALIMVIIASKIS